MKGWAEELCRRMPKAELHLHLDGALEVKAALDLAAERGWRDFEKPLSWREMHERLVVKGRLSSQKELLAYFEVPGLLLDTREALSRVTRELIARKAADNVRYCEIRWAPQLHTGGGLSVGAVTESVLSAAREAGEAYGVAVELIAVGMRTHSAERNLAMLDEISGYAGQGICAVDLAGPEAAAPDALEHRVFFERAREMGLGITFHCGELPGCAARLRRQAEELNPARIAHGPGASEDSAVCALLRERDIMLDLCPTSNLQAGLYADYKEYPLKRLAEAGVPVSLNTDDSVVSSLELSEEYARMLSAGQTDLPGLWRLNLNALEHAFAPRPVKEGLRREFESWAENVPELTICG